MFLRSHNLLEQIVGVAMTCTIILTPFLINLVKLFTSKFDKDSTAANVLSICLKIALLPFAFGIALYKEIKGIGNDNFFSWSESFFLRKFNPIHSMNPY